MSKKPIFSPKKIKIRWIRQREAREFLYKNHRTQKTFTGSIFQLGYFENDLLCAVLVASRPANSGMNFYQTLDISRVGTIENTHYACSRLYSRAAKIAKLYGFSRLITYIDDSESGISLKSANWTLDRKDCGLLKNKIRWTKEL